jgi:hypothetical protein
MMPFGWSANQRAFARCRNCRTPATRQTPAATSGLPRGVSKQLNNNTDGRISRWRPDDTTTNSRYSQDGRPNVDTCSASIDYFDDTRYQIHTRIICEAVFECSRNPR